MVTLPLHSYRNPNIQQIISHPSFIRVKIAISVHATYGNALNIYQKSRVHVQYITSMF